MAFDEQLAERIRKGLVGHNPVEKRMFGGLCFMVNGAMCCGVYKNDFVARVGDSQHDEAIAQPHTRLMDITGRPMRGFLFVGPDGVRTETQFKKWLNWCTSYSASNEVQKRLKRTNTKSQNRRKPRS